MFTASAVGIFNCQRVQVESSNFHNCTALKEKAVLLGSNSAGISLFYNMNDTTIGKLVYFNASLHASIRIKGCMFTQNHVGLPRDTHSQNQFEINQLINNVTKTVINSDRGGGIGIFVRENYTNISITIDSCHFEDNFAYLFGGGLYVNTRGSEQRSLTVHNCTFTGNEVSRVGYGGGLHITVRVRGMLNSPSQFQFRHCRFFRNRATYGGGMNILQVYSEGHGILFSLTDSYFKENVAHRTGSAVAFSSQAIALHKDTSYQYHIKNK